MDATSKAERRMDFRDGPVRFNCTARRWRLGVCALAIAVGALAGCGSGRDQADASAQPTQTPTQPAPPPAPTYKLPPADASSLLVAIEAVRELDGSIAVEGTSLLPPNTQVWVERISRSGQNLGQSKTRVGENGEFAARGFSDRGKPIQPGRGAVEVRAHFNGLWQTPDVLAIVGENGANLPQSVLTPDDPEFPAQGGHWVEKRELQYPEIAPETIAIERVKGSKLNVQGQGRSPTAVKDVVAWYATTPGFTAQGWSAEQSGTKWVVTLQCTDGGQPKKAQWEYDTANQSVRYLDPLSKILSWLPED